MDIELIDKLDDIINTLDNSNEIKRIRELKDIIYKDKDLKIKLDEFNSIDNKYSSRYLELKKEILSNQYVKEFKSLENDLLLLTFGINNRLNTLTNKGNGCHENN